MTGTPSFAASLNSGPSRTSSMRSSSPFDSRSCSPRSFQIFSPQRQPQQSAVNVQSPVGKNRDGAGRSSPSRQWSRSARARRHESGGEWRALPLPLSCDVDSSFNSAFIHDAQNIGGSCASRWLWKSIAANFALNTECAWPRAWSAAGSHRGEDRRRPWRRPSL